MGWGIPLARASLTEEIVSDAFTTDAGLPVGALLLGLREKFGSRRLGYSNDEAPNLARRSVHETGSRLWLGPVFFVGGPLGQESSSSSAKSRQCSR